MFTSFALANHLLLLLFIALLIRGWHIVTRPGMLFDFIGKRLLYIEEEELLKQLPNDLREQKLLALLAFEGSLQQISSTSSPTEAPPAELAEAKAILFAEFEAYLHEIKTYTDVNYEHLAAAYEQKRHRQRWKKWIGKPLGNCVTCASSVFGICGMGLAYLPMITAGSLTPVLLVVLVVSLPVVAGIGNIFESK